jgi:uncharacterized protein (DUF2141 family)
MANARLRIEVDGLRSDNGHLMAALYDRPQGFPREGKPVREQKVEIRDGRATADFGDLAAGTYAIAVLHDENDDGKMNTNWMKLPKEGFGMSNFDKLKMSAPSFEDSKIEFAGADQVVAVKIHYIL